MFREILKIGPGSSCKPLVSHLKSRDWKLGDLKWRNLHDGMKPQIPLDPKSNPKLSVIFCRSPILQTPFGDLCSLSLASGQSVLVSGYLPGPLIQTAGAGAALMAHTGSSTHASEPRKAWLTCDSSPTIASRGQHTHGRRQGEGQ